LVIDQPSLATDVIAGAVSGRPKLLLDDSPPAGVE
jgi:hypothetical protein